MPGLVWTLNFVFFTFWAFIESSEAEEGHISLLPDTLQYLKGQMSDVCGCFVAEMKAHFEMYIYVHTVKRAFWLE